MQIEAGDCMWAGQQNCAMWHRILVFSGFLVALDSGAMVVSSFVGRVFEQSPKRSLRLCAAIPLNQHTYYSFVPPWWWCSPLLQFFCRALHEARWQGACGVAPLANTSSQRRCGLRCRASTALHVVALFCESGLIATTMALTATNDEASVSTFLFLCGSLFITVLCFIASLVGISHILRAALSLIHI